MRESRLFMMGLDAASLPFIRANLSALPNLGGMLSEGRLRKLRSTADYLSDSVWPTFISGRMPGEHGHYFPMQWDAPSQRFRRISSPVWSQRLNAEPFWHPLVRKGIRVIALDCAHVLHDAEAPCLQISNWSGQSSGVASASEPDVLREIRRRFGRRPIGPEVPVAKTRRECEEIRARLTDAVCRKADAVCYLMERPWDLFLTGFYELHRAGHNLWQVEGAFASDAAPDAMLAVYSEMDHQIGRIRVKLREIAGDDAGFVAFSLHGIEANRAQNHFLPEMMDRLNAVYLGRPVSKTSEARAGNLMAYLRRVLPPSVQYRLAPLLGEDVQETVVNRALTGGRDWAATPAFPIHSGGEGLIRLNIRGRERDGYFAEDDVAIEEYLTWLRARLSEVTVVETGEPLIAEIALARELYSGERLNHLPDIVLRWAPAAPANRIYSPVIGEITHRLATGRGGNHNDDAFVVLTGPAHLDSAAERIDHIVDLAAIAQAHFAATRRRRDSSAA